MAIVMIDSPKEGELVYKKPNGAIEVRGTAKKISFRREVPEGEETITYTEYHTPSNIRVKCGNGPQQSATPDRNQWVCEVQASDTGGVNLFVDWTENVRVFNENDDLVFEYTDEKSLRPLRSIMLAEDKPPTVTKFSILPAGPLFYDDLPISFTVSGTVFDAETGVGKVLVSLWENRQDAAGQETKVTVIPEREVDVSDHRPNQSASWSTDLRISAPGHYEVSVRSRDTNSYETPPLVPFTAPVVVAQLPKPVPKITSHKDGEVIPGTDQGAEVTIKGTAMSPDSTVTLVQVVVDNATFDEQSLAIQDAPPGWSQWSKTLRIPVQGSHTITVRATNSAKNSEWNHGEDTVTVAVGVAYKPQDLEDNISLLAYFKDLLIFAMKRVLLAVGTTERNLTLKDLTQQFYQPFDRLKTNETVLQIRLCVEVLRSYLAAINKTSDPGVERRYRESAYQALLTQFGTSYDELRRDLRMRPEDNLATADRQSLAARLGIDADKVGQLLLSPEQMTEETLERIFGLADTTRDPLATTALPLLYQWQIDHLRTLWWEQDQPDSGIRTQTPIIDPDIVSDNDLASNTGFVYDLWKVRTDWINEKLNNLANDTQASDSDQIRLERLVDKVLMPVTMNDLLGLETQRLQGHDITTQLAQYHLSLPAFSLIMHLRSVPRDGAFLKSEWDDVYSILVQAMKLREYDAWRAQENNLTLAPDYFILTSSEPPLPRWRATVETRRAWLGTLQGRIDQLEATRQAFLAAVSAAEALVLPTLREAFVATVSAATDIDVANWLTQRLMVDVKSSGLLNTTRLSQAIETVQGILTALRAERFMEMDSQIGPIPSETWKLTEPNAEEAEIGEIFDQEWTWMGTYASWRAAMRVFHYPENLLLPSLRKDMTPEFQAMLAELRAGQRITPKVAHDMAKSYLNTVEKNQLIWDTLNNLNSKWKEESFVLDESMEEAELLKRAAAIEALIGKNKSTQPLQRYMEELFYFVPIQLGLQLHQAGQYTAALDWFRTVYGYNLPVGKRKVYYGLKQEEGIPSVYQTTDQWLRTTLNPHDLAPVRTSVFTRFTILSIARCFLDYADSEFAIESGETTARARTLYLGVLDMLGSADMLLPNNGGDPAEKFGFVPNPEPRALRMHAEANLAKLRSGRNIAGMQRQIVLYASQGRAAGETSSPTGVQPTPYRYPTLIDRAKQLVTLAQQMEERYLSALEKKDAETYNLIKARHDLGLTQATIQLQDLRVNEANAGIAMATLQKSRAQTQRDTYKKWIDGGKIQAEKDLLQNYSDANDARNWMAKLDAACTVAQAVQSGIAGAAQSLGGSIVASLVTSGLAIARSDLAVNINNVEAATQANSFNASYERRKQEWQLQQSLAEKDVEIGNQQYVQAQYHQSIVKQERMIAQMQANHAQATVDFLANKFTNAELYHWMSGVLGRVYNYFLQQATAIAQLAQNQLAFERQEKPLAVIRTDYWQLPNETGAPGNTTDGNRDRRGLTGSARLLQDIYQLDQYAFETNKRKLQLSKTISLAQLAPFEFQYFRQTGVLSFATPMTLFDQDFPGHYLRLIRRVRTSVVALVPPNQGIRASLATSGLSRVTLADGGFRNVLVRRDPELVALTSPLNGTGVFELDVQSELLLPFEGIGVDTSWMFEMPKAANPFDYRTIADVLITIEYTALHSFDYRQQVIQRLERAVSADRSFSLHDHFPDQWYELNNSDQSDTPLSISFKIAREDYPPNIEELQVQNLILYFIGKNGSSFKAPVTNLQLSYLDTQGNKATVGGDATPIDGIISTRRGNAANWKLIISKPPHGDWNLTLPNTEQMKKQFKDREIDDILFVITYSGQRPAWPT